MLLIIIAILTALAGIGILLWAQLSKVAPVQTAEKKQETKKPVVVERKPSIEPLKPLSAEELKLKERMEIKRLEKTMEINNEQKKKEREQENLRLARELEELKLLRALQRKKKQQTPTEESSSSKNQTKENEQPAGRDTATVADSPIEEKTKPPVNVEESAETSSASQSHPAEGLESSSGDDILTTSVVMVEIPEKQQSEAGAQSSPKGEEEQQKQGAPTTTTSESTALTTSGQQEEEWVMIEDDERETARDELRTDAERKETTEY